MSLLLRNAHSLLRLLVLLSLTLSCSTALANRTQLQLESICQRDESRPVTSEPAQRWQAVERNYLQIPVAQSCWLRITRPDLTALRTDEQDNQFLAFENSWGSDFWLYDDENQLLAHSTVSGVRQRAIEDKSWLYVAFSRSTPKVLYAKVQSLQHFSMVRHKIYQVDGQQIVRHQRLHLYTIWTAWLLWSAAVFSLLIFALQRQRLYALFSLFSCGFAITLFSDRGEFAALGWMASGDWISLSYPLSGMLLIRVALEVGRLNRYAPWAGRILRLGIGLYACLAVWQLTVVLGLPLPTAHFETVAQWVYDAASMLQVLILWGGFRGWQKGDRGNLWLAIGVTPLILFDIQISDWLANLAPEVAAYLTREWQSTLRVVSYVALPMMFFGVIAYRGHQAQRRTVHLAQHDQLTNLPNRDHFVRLGQAMLDQSTDAVLLTISVDRLKTINEVMGFEVGDAVIRQVAQRLATIEHGILARVHTSQFCLLLPHIALLSPVGRQIDNAFRTPVTVQDHTLDVSLRIGMAQQSEAHTMPDLLRDADVALGVAKATRTNWLPYDESMNTTRPESLSLLSELTQAIEQNELRLYLQPKISLRDGSVLGAEALLRWIHPARGMVPPNDFIPFAEQTGKITALTSWVVREGARLSAILRRDHRPLLISVNISTSDLREPHFAERLQALVEAEGGQPQDIRLEVTETGMMEDPKMSLGALHALRDAGFSLAVDDFGTGYSSLAYLQKMPVTELKIDRSFVRHVQAGTDSASLLDSIISLGHRLGLSVVAEGAETASELHLLQTLGCDYVQGWVVAKAMPFEEFLRWQGDWQSTAFKPTTT